jgi:P-type Ca2+ transporter type 2C
MPTSASGNNGRSEAGPSSGEAGPAIMAIHTAVEGRTRYQVPGLHGSPTLKNLLESALAYIPAVVSTSGNVLTGNILVLHDPQLSREELTGLLQDLLFQFRSAPARAKTGGATDGKLRRRELRKSVAQGREQQAGKWHLLESDEVASRLETSPSGGLTQELLPALMKRYGPNLLAESVPRSGMSILLGQFKSLPVVLLGASAALSVVTGGIADAVVILTVVGINAAIGYLTESHAEMTIHSLKRLVRPDALVIRSGNAVVVKGEEVVPGDLLVLRPGSYIAADCRIVASRNLTIDESALTGESLPVGKSPHPLDEENPPLGDRLNMAFMGTLVTGGQGLAIVVATGRFTEIGKVQAMVGEAEAPKTPMEKQLERLGDQLVLVSGAVCGAVFLVGLMRGYGALQMLRSSVSLAVAAIPEGLPAVATTTLAIGIRQMKQHKVLIRHLDAVETLGSVQTICLDKTGTLTFNRMSVVAVTAGLREYEVKDGLFSAKGGDAETAAAGSDILRLLEICALCNESELEKNDGGYTLRGSSTENALIDVAMSSGIEIGKLREDHPLQQIVHRSESRNYMISVHDIAGSGRFSTPGDENAKGDGRLVAIKGSPIEVLELCAWRLADGELQPLADDDRLSVELNNERLAGASLRVLGAAFMVYHGDTPLESCREYVWLGLVGMADPVRPGVKDVITAFHGAGIDTLMITGDQVPTAYAIGRDLDVSRSLPLQIFDSSRLQETDPELLTALAQKVQVFARVSPAQKLQIVRALQRGGRVVAMTGDGINDSPALKAADIGIAMGSAGTDVAREVADVVLEDDELQTMVVAISQGRTIYSNIRKSVNFLLATNLTEIMMMFGAIATGLGQPLNPMQLLWINLVTDIFPAQALALEAPEPGVLERPPRDPGEEIISAADLGRIAREGGFITAGAMGAYLFGMMRYGPGPKASSLGFMSLVSGQLLHAISCRSESASIFEESRIPPNNYLRWALLGSFALQACTVAVPGLRRLLGIAPIAIVDYLVAGGSAVLPLLANEALKSPKGEAT